MTFDNEMFVLGCGWATSLFEFEEESNSVNLKHDIDFKRLRSLLTEIKSLINPTSNNWSDEMNFPWPSMLSLPENLSSKSAAAVKLARELRRIRMNRSKFLPASLFADPAWDIILDLFIAHHETRRSSVKTVCLASGVPSTTALRWITILEKAGLIVRKKDESDSRVRCIELSSVGYDAIRGLLDEILRNSSRAISSGSTSNISKDDR